MENRTTRKDVKIYRNPVCFAPLKDQFKIGIASEQFTLKKQHGERNEYSCIYN